MARPTRPIPAIERTACGGVVEHHARPIAIDHVIKPIDIVLGLFVQVHHQHFRAGGVEHLFAQGGQCAFVHDPGAAFAQRLAQLTAKLHVIEQQRYRSCRFSH